MPSAYYAIHTQSGAILPDKQIEMRIQFNIQFYILDKTWFYIRLLF